MKHNRRKFLKQLGTLGLVSAVMPAISAMPDKDEKHSSNKPKRKVISLLQTTDVHCQIHPHDELFWENNQTVFRKTGGYSKIAHRLKTLKKENPDTYIIDTGDMFQGSELSVKTTGKAMVPILNAMPYNLYLPGNWEVIYGKKNMQTLLGALHAPKICTNMFHDLGEGKRGEMIFKPYEIWHVAGIKIGFLGYTDPLVPIRQSPNYSKGIIYSKPEENLAHYIDLLKNQEQCAFIILLAHLGLSQQIALANHPACEGVNYIFGGDTHERVRVPIQCKYAKVVEPGAFGSFIGKLDLTIESGKVVDERYNLLEVGVDEKQDLQVEQIVQNNEAIFAKHINQIIGYSTIPLYRYFVIENPIDTMVLNALHWKFPEIDVVLSNGFRFCPPRTTADHTGNIPLTNGFVVDMLPVDSVVRVAKATGTQINEWLEKELNNVFAKDANARLGGWVVKFKGMKITFNAFGENGKRVQSIMINNQPLNPDQLYSILACERDGDPADMLCRMKHVSEAKNTSVTLHQLMTAYITQNSPITPIPEKNAISLDAPETLLTQVTGVDYTFR